MQFFPGTRIVNPADHKEKLNSDGQAYDFAKQNNYTAFTRPSGGDGTKRVFYYFSKKSVDSLKERISIKKETFDSFLIEPSAPVISHV
jgi:hypothetical protein